jgi:hypothetical protein
VLAALGKLELVLALVELLSQQYCQEVRTQVFTALEYCRLPSPDVSLANLVDAFSRKPICCSNSASSSNVLCSGARLMLLKEVSCPAPVTCAGSRSGYPALRNVSTP